ncbi:uncharacterized protein L203_104896 [Cryptococcus depauperatus CBS 7841]|uniref:Uncharacterized protein n=1 Tax=Cryptococcus depauperatus CBS 7841 TaxID=1295531 RepID=A0A1E3IN70_9TREE|nr:hypothetical protein L203_01895 [Cryptococcus depauperatus CBS 7841]
MPKKFKSADSNMQNRESQRRSRARRKELVEDLSRQLAEYKRQGVAASVAMQTAARAVSVENQRLRALLALHGVSQGEIDLYVASPQPAASYMPNTDPIRRSGTTSQTSSDSPFARTGSRTRAHDMPNIRPRRQKSPLSNATRSVLMDAGAPRISAATMETVPLTSTPIPFPPAARLCHEEVHSRPQHGDEERCRWPAQDCHGNAEQPAYSKHHMVDDILPPVSECFCPPEPSAAETGGKEGPEMSCDTAAAILIQLHGKPDPAQARAALGCIGSTSCSVKNTTLFRLMDELD